MLDFVRIVRELDARTFVFENVKGLTVGKQKAFLAELVEASTRLEMRPLALEGFECSALWGAAVP